jgi:uncharacterized protein YutE (UPF0331/DUF86 family)
MDEAYRDAMREHIATLEEELQELTALLADGNAVSRLHRRAAERTLQLLIESCIGICKQALKGRGVVVPSDSREAIAKAASFGAAPVALDWRRIIGMRNALVHDYLNIDVAVLFDIYRSGRWRELVTFANSLLDAA